MDSAQKRMGRQTYIRTYVRTYERTNRQTNSEPFEQRPQQQKSQRSKIEWRSFVCHIQDLDIPVESVAARQALLPHAVCELEQLSGLGYLVEEVAAEQAKSRFWPYLIYKSLLIRVVCVRSKPN